MYYCVYDVIQAQTQSFPILRRTRTVLFRSIMLDIIYTASCTLNSTHTSARYTTTFRIPCMMCYRLPARQFSWVRYIFSGIFRSLQHHLQREFLRWRRDLRPCLWRMGARFPPNHGYHSNGTAPDSPDVLGWRNWCDYWFHHQTQKHVSMCVCVHCVSHYCLRITLLFLSPFE